MKVVSKLALLCILGLSSLHGVEYTVDKSHSTVGFKIRHMMVASVRGKFNDFEGSYNYDPVKKIISSLSGHAKIASVDTDDKERDKHLRSKDFFDAKKFPEMTLKLIKHNGDKALVALSIKDVTKKIVFDVDYLSSESKDPWGNIKTGFELNGKISRKEYNIMFNKILETGGVAVGDEVKIYLEIEGVRAKAK